MSFVVYYLLDLIGRLLAGYITINTKPEVTSKRLLLVSVLRTLFIPLFLLCPAQESVIPHVFNSDVMTFFLLAKLALTNGMTMTIWLFYFCIRNGWSWNGSERDHFRDNESKFVVGFTGRLCPKFWNSTCWNWTMVI